MLALVICGLAIVELNEEGPVQEKLLPDKTVELNDRVAPAHIVLLLFAAGEGFGFMCMFRPLLPDISAGIVVVILMRYPVPAAPTGNIASIVPDEVEVTEPILTGAAKLPDASDNCALKTLPALKYVGAVYGMLIVSPAQNSVSTLNVIAGFITTESIK